MEIKIKSFYKLIKNYLLFSLLIFNLKYINNQKTKIKSNEEKGQLFEQKILERNLEEKNNPTDEICSRSNSDLNEYYQTGSSEKLKLEENITCKDKNKYYIKALIKIVKKITFENYNEEEDEGLNIREKEDKTSTKDKRTLSKKLVNYKNIKGDIINYSKHLIPILIFLVIGILCIPGWLVCCFCSCFDCFCFCFKKPSFKIPCFIFTFILFAVIFIFCILGYIKSNSIFVGLDNIECSVFQFLDQILDGETKNKSLRWVGISGVHKFLYDLFSLDSMEGRMKNHMDNKRSIINSTKKSFLTYMQRKGEDFFNGDNYKDAYSQDYTGIKIGDEILNGRYVLDIVKMFGKYDATSEKYLPENSTLNLWEKEFSDLSKTGDKYMDKAYKSLSILLKGPDNLLIYYIKEIMKFIKPEFDNIKIILIEYFEFIEKNGKLSFILLFCISGLIIVIIAVVMLLILCSRNFWKKRSRCRCAYKIIIHILWNILSLIMIITFLVGSIIALCGQIGSDIISLISYIIGVDGNEFEKLDGFLGDVCDRCMNGDGQMIEEIGFTPIEVYNKVKEVEKKIEETKLEFNKKKQFVTYNIYKDKLLNRVNLNDTQLCLILQDADFDSQNLKTLANTLNFDLILEKMNELIQIDRNAYSYHEIWDKTSQETDKICKDGELGSFSHPRSELILNPKYCLPFYRNWINNLGANNEIRNTAKIISDTILFIDNANKNIESYNDYFKILNDLKEQYENYLETYIDSLDFFNNTIKKVIGILNENSFDEKLSFINCKFIGTNTKIIIKYAKITFQNNIYIVGIFLLIIGCSSSLSICSTIFLIVIINLDIKKESLFHKVENKIEKKLDNTEEISMKHYISNS